MATDLFKKLQYKTGRAIVLHAPEGYELGVDTEEKLEGDFDFVQLFVSSAEETRERIPLTLPHLKEDAVFWVCYPKAAGKVKPDINRDKLFALIASFTDYRAVSNVAIDDNWSALRFRHNDKVKK